MDLGLLLLRAVVGLTLAAHGVQKLFGWFGGYGLDGTGAFLEKMGFLPGRRHAFMAGASEAGAGLLLAVGLEAIDQLGDVRLDAGQPFRQLSERQLLAGLGEDVQRRQLGQRQADAAQAIFDVRLGGRRRVQQRLQVRRRTTAWFVHR